MDKLEMQTKNLAEEKFKKLQELFPNAVTETIDEDGKLVKAIDKDILMQEISTEVVEGREERYQFTWPDKRNAILTANAPISKTLRPCKDESVNFDDTKNLYIEGDNLEVLKLLQETYLSKINMIYIDPPYNTGSDFIYNDNFKSDLDEYLEDSGQFDEAGNRLEKNLESNGRFHTDWLNMMYPRLKLARNLLTDDGVIFISIDDNEQVNLKKICDEIFGAENLINIIAVKMSELSGVKMANVNRYPKLKEYIVIYAKNINEVEMKIEKVRKSGDKLTGYLRYYSNIIINYFDKVENWIIKPINEYLNDNNISIESEDQLNEWKLSNSERIVYRTNSRTVTNYLKENPHSSEISTIENNVGKTIIKWGDKEMLFLKDYIDEYIGDMWMDISTINLNKENMGLNFFQNGQKPLKLIKRIINSLEDNKIILDFFSGSATTAHAIMELNGEDGGKRNFIMVQLPEETDEKSEAYQAGYKNICEIGKERIRRAGKKIIDENKDKEGIENLDIGFRVLKTDTSNMKDVYYAPAEIEQSLLDLLSDNIKEDRTPEDLLFQIMLDLGVSLSSKIERDEIDNKEVFIVEDGFLIACFDKNINDDIVKVIAKKKPYYAVFRDSSMASDSVATNFEQIFESISPQTVRKVI